mgnify:CR=1 FL=1
MIEKFADFEKSQYLDKEGTFTFTITNAELTATKKGDQMWKFECDSDAGKTTLYHAILPTTKWSFNKLIAACLNLTPKQKQTFELDYETIGRQLIGKSFDGTVEQDTYEKEIKVPNDDGTFSTTTETKTSYKIKKYDVAGSKVSNEPLPF